MMKIIGKKSEKKYARTVLSAVVTMIAGLVSAQQTYTFTNAGATGQFGPNQTQITNAYNSTNLAGAVTVMGSGIQTWTVPGGGTYKIVAIGASGGAAQAYTHYGRGASMEGVFTLTSGQVLKIIVGQEGAAGGAGGSGGGGSFVADFNNTALIVAGGGAGGGNYANPVANIMDGRITNYGANYQSTGRATAGGGGGSFNVSGLNVNGGTSFIAGGVGGGLGGTNGGYGGFGGGAGSSGSNALAAGGGGYSGGDEMYGYQVYQGAEGGGGSYNAGTNQVNAAGVNTGHGRVLITRMCDLAMYASKNPICAGETLTLTSNAGSNILWNTGATTSSIIVSPPSTTGYTMTGVSSSSSACTSTVSIVVAVLPLPSMAVYSFPPVICQGGSGMMSASGAASYAWSNGNTGASVPVTPNLTSVFTVTGTSADGCVNTETVAVTVNTNSLTVSQSTSVCKGSSVNLSASGVSSALWSTGASFLSISVTPSINTVYTVSGPDPLGCILSNSVTVNVLNVPAVTITADKQTVCRGESVTLTASGATSYVWDDQQTTAVVVKTLPVDVVYQFIVTGMDANNCTASYQITVNGSACTGLKENALAGISIFPNPVSNYITVSGTAATKKIIVISDIYGKTVLLTETSDLSLDVNVENLPAGVYNIQVTEGDITTDQKFVKL